MSILFSSRIFMIFFFTLKSSMHLEFILVYFGFWYKTGIRFAFSSVVVGYCQSMKGSSLSLSSTSYKISLKRFPYLYLLVVWEFENNLNTPSETELFIGITFHLWIILEIICVFTILIFSYRHEV